MKKEEFIALGISEELAAKAEAASVKELEGFVPKEQLETANTEKRHLRDDIKARDNQLEELRKSSGDNAELKKQIEELQKANRADAEKHAGEMKELRLTGGRVICRLFCKYFTIIFQDFWNKKVRQK